MRRLYYVCCLVQCAISYECAPLTVCLICEFIQLQYFCYAFCVLVCVDGVCMRRLCIWLSHSNGKCMVVHIWACACQCVCLCISLHFSNFNQNRFQTKLRLVAIFNLIVYTTSAYILCEIVHVDSGGIRLYFIVSVFFIISII